MRHYKIAEPPRYYELSRVGRTVARNKCRQTKENFGTYTHERGGLPYITRDTTAAHDRSTALVYRETESPLAFITAISA